MRHETGLSVCLESSAKTTLAEHPVVGSANATPDDLRCVIESTPDGKCSYLLIIDETFDFHGATALEGRHMIGDDSQAEYYYVIAAKDIVRAARRGSCPCKSSGEIEFYT